MFHIGICDDENITCSNLEEMLLEIEKDLNVEFEIDIWSDGAALCNYLKNVSKFDLIFLDIELYEMNGVEVAGYIRNEINDLKTSLVFISHKKSYAMELFKMQPLDFLVKPLSKDNVMAVMKTFMLYYQTDNKYFEYKKGTNYLKIEYENILYFRSNNRKIEVILQNETDDFYGKLSDIAKTLPGYFLQIHKSYIINQKSVIHYTYEQVVMHNGDIITISRDFRKKSREEINRYKVKSLLGETNKNG